MKNIKKYQISLMYILFLVVQTVQSQDFGFNDDVEDVTPAPIDDYIIPAIVLMILFGFYFIYKRQRQSII
jgi:hypothetical protein